jgi:cysteine desulfurase/selenocysteine lyase
MATKSRRDFIKKNLLGGLYFTSTVPLISIPINSQAEELFSFEEIQTTTDYKDINWKKIRKQFLLDTDKTYLNTASLGPSPKIVLKTIYDSMVSLETSCETGHGQIEAVHEKLGKFLNVGADEIAITRNATEGMNIIAQSLNLSAGDEVIITTHEHVGGAAPWMHLKNTKDIVIKLIDLDITGEFNLQLINDAITPKTKAVCFSHITCSTGMKLPAKEIVDYCRKKGVYTCIDGAQALGMFKIDLKDINPDFYTASGHKWLTGPKGTGILFINKNIINKIKPVFAGAYTDTKYDLNNLILEYRDTAQREEYGTRNTSLALGFGAAIDFISGIGIDHIEKRGAQLAQLFIERMFDYPEIEILTPDNKAYAASIVTFKIKGINYLDAIKKLNSEKNIRLRGIYESNLNAIRVSFAFYNNEEEVTLLANGLKEMLGD